MISLTENKLINKQKNVYFGSLISRHCFQNNYLFGNPRDTHMGPFHHLWLKFWISSWREALSDVLKLCWSKPHTCQQIIFDHIVMVCMWVGGYLLQVKYFETDGHGRRASSSFILSHVDFRCHKLAIWYLTSRSGVRNQLSTISKESRARLTRPTT